MGQQIYTFITGRFPLGLYERGEAACEAVVLNEGLNAFLRRLSEHFGLQSLGAVLGMDWHSSGITIFVLGALEKGLQNRRMN